MTPAMDLMSQKFTAHQSESVSPITSPPANSFFGSSLHSSHAGFPIIAVAIIGIVATGFLLVSYYIFVIKCCLNWHRIDLLRRFSFSRNRNMEDPLAVRSPEVENRGLDAMAIRSIPVFLYKESSGRGENGDRKSSECSVCLNEFQQEEKLKAIPNCGHVFHIDCIDVWLQNNANCPLCRTSISANIRPFNGLPLDHVLAPVNTPQEPGPFAEHFTSRDEDYVVIEIREQEQNQNHHHNQNPTIRAQDGLNSGESLPSSISPSPRKSEPKPHRKKPKKFRHLSSMGDECINIREKDKQFEVQPIRRSFSMDSAADSQLYLAVQEIIQQQRLQVIDTSPIEASSSSNSRMRKSFFPFGHGRASKSAVQPVPLEPEI